MSKIQTPEDLNKTLLNVRKAHRLIKEYQERILNFIFYTKEKFNMPSVKGIRRFCNPFSNYQSGYGRLKVWKDMWSWDFLYSYEFEYYFGVDSTRMEGKEFALSIFQISDSGFYKSKSDNGNDISTFLSPEESESLFMFVFEVSENEEWFWEKEFENAKQKLITENKDEYIIENRYLAVTYNIKNFLNQEYTDIKLNDFNTKIYSNFGINLMKK